MMRFLLSTLVYQTKVPSTKRAVAGTAMDEQDIEKMRGKFRRICEPKRASGLIEIPETMFKKYQAKGASRERLFEAFVRTGGVKDWAFSQLHHAFSFTRNPNIV